MIQCCLNVGPPSPTSALSDVSPALKQHWVNVSCMLGSAPVINSRPNTATLTKCWASVVDGVPALKQRWLHVIVQRSACLPVKDVWAVCPRGIHYTQLTQGDVESMLTQHLSTIYDVGQTLANFDSTSCLCWPANTHVWGLYNMPIGHSLPNKTNIHLFPLG